MSGKVRQWWKDNLNCLETAVCKISGKALPKASILPIIEKQFKISLDLANEHSIIS